MSAAMWWIVYQVALVLAYPLVRLRLVWRARKEPAYGERVSERFGHAPADTPSGAIWFHAVSAGETIAAAPLVRRVADGVDLPVLVTSMTPTGAERAAALLGDCARCYAPYDFPWAVRRFFDLVAPRLLVLVETELWPNLVAEAHRRGVDVLMVNARLSGRSAAGYARVGGLMRLVLERVAHIACQTETHRARFIDLGAAPERVSSVGSVKFDVALPADFTTQADALRERWRLTPRPVWIGASTHPGEDEQLLRAHAELRERHPTAHLILVPRHPVRAGDVTELARAAGFSARRQSDDGPVGDVDVTVGDVMGTLQLLYGVADVAFVGGSLVDHGGHNPLEPSVCAKPVLMGPADFNFEAVVAVLVDAGGLRVVASATALAEVLAELLGDASRRAEMGERAAAAVGTHAGATDRLCELIRSRLAVGGG